MVYKMTVQYPYETYRRDRTCSKNICSGGVTTFENAN